MTVTQSDMELKLLNKHASCLSPQKKLDVHGFTYGGSNYLFRGPYYPLVFHIIHMQCKCGEYFPGRGSWGIKVGLASRRAVS